MIKNFKEWLAEEENSQNEVSTSTSCVAGFARKTLPMVTRQWLGPWGEEDPFFKKKKGKKKNESTSTASVASVPVPPQARSRNICPKCKGKTSSKELSINSMCSKCAQSFATSG